MRNYFQFLSESCLFSHAQVSNDEINDLPSRAVLNLMHLWKVILEHSRNVRIRAQLANITICHLVGLETDQRPWNADKQLEAPPEKLAVSMSRNEYICHMIRTCAKHLLRWFPRYVFIRFYLSPHATIFTNLRLA